MPETRPIPTPTPKPAPAPNDRFDPTGGITRRRFLNRALATGTITPVIVSAQGSPRPQPTAGTSSNPKRQVKLGVVGCGGRGAWIARLFQQHGGYHLWAVADYFPAVADACGQQLGVDPSRRFSGLLGFRKVIESGIEAIALETPPYFFPEQARVAVDAGLHVYMAKPVAVDTWGCLEIEAAAGRATAAHRVFLVDYQIPTEPANVQVVDMIRAGEIGRLIALNSHYFAGTFADPPKTANLESRFQSLIWCNDVALGGGYHVNACIHAVDAALWIAGSRPQACFGRSRVGRPDPHGDSHDVFQLIFEFADGLILDHRGKHLNNLTGFDVVAQAHGDQGHAQICYGGKSFVKGPENGCHAEVANPYEPGALRNIAHFHTSVVEGQTANETVRRSVDGALTTILGREAALRGQRLTMAELLQQKQRLPVDLSGLKM